MTGTLIFTTKRQSPIFKKTGSKQSGIVGMLMVAAILLAAMPLASAEAKRMQAPGSRISLDLPDNFKPSPLFAGFMEIISSAAVIILEVPANGYDKITKGFTPEALAKKGITKVKIGKLARQGDYLFVTGQQKHPRALFEKMILVIKDTKDAAIITFNVPTTALESGALNRETVLKTLASARFETKAAPSNDLFKLGYLGPFVLSGKPIGTTRTYTEKDTSDPKATRNVIVIAPSLNRLPVHNIKDFSQYAIKSLNTVKGLAISSAKDVRIDNMTGHQLTASGKRGASKTPVIVRQLILLPTKGGYLRLLSVTKTEDEKRLAPEIEKIFASFKATEALLAR